MPTRSWCAVAVLLSVVSPAAVAKEASDGPLPPAVVRLAWIDPAGSAVGLEPQARAETEKVLRKMGVATAWRRGEARELARAGEVRVIFLDRAARRAPNAPLLGATPESFQVSPFVWVHVPSVASFLGLNHRDGARRSLLDSRALGIALGRVIAHEVVHAVAPSVPHGTGLMSASLTRQQLTASSIPFAAEVALAVRTAILGDPRRPGPDTGVLTAATAAEDLLR